ncbi:MAG: alpha-2-macroglobulin, partial [Prevotella sp.]
AAQGQVTFEYTNHPTWLMIQALPVLGQPVEENAISQAASYYANSLGRYILAQYPQAKKAFDLWRQELTAPEPVEGAQHSDKLSHRGSLVSQLEKNQELKAIVLNETPWVMDADRETEQKQRLVDFFDANVMQNRLDKALNKMRQLQRSDGSWSWWPDMPGSFYMTVSVSEMLVRLNAMTGTQAETKEMLNTAFVFMGREMVKEVAELKKWEKKGHEVSFPSLKALQWLYLCTLDGRQLPANVQSANSYLLKLLKKDITSQPIYEKAMTAVILSKSDPRRATEYAQSLKEYTVYREEMGRYYDTPRAGYSWFDYRIPTQTMAIEALQRLTPDDRQTIEEMQRWLLQSKRTQAWDTPLNSVDAVYAFLGEQDQNANTLRLDAENATVKVDGKVLELPKATAAIGYVKTRVPAESRQLSIVKTSEGTSWGTVYVQFSQAAKNVAAAGSGLTIKREILSVSRAQCFDKLSHPVFAVGDRVKVRLTITADRDYDFVQVIDKRAACLEPVHQLSGYHHGGYVTPRDNTTNYYYDLLSKGTHVIETEYYVDRAGTYETGTCVVECAYAPEFRGITPSTMITVEK